MMSEARRIRRRYRAGDQESQASGEAAAEAAAGSTSGTSQDEIVAGAPAALVRLREVILGHLVEARGEHARQGWSPDIDRKIRELKSSNAAIISTEDLLRDQKRLQNLRIDDLRYFRKMFRAKSASGWSDD